MPTIFTHALVGLALGTAAYARPMPWKFWCLAAGCAALPDADVLLVAAGGKFDGPWGHRGITHSLLFAAVLAISVVCVFFRNEAARFDARWWRYVAFFFLVTSSHALLDACTNGGPGITFFAPFDPARYFFPFRPIKVAPVGVRSAMNSRVLTVLLSEMQWVWLPTIVAMTIALIVRRFLGVRRLRMENAPGRAGG